MVAGTAPKPEPPIHDFADRKSWERWLAKNHSKSSGVRIRFAKKGSGLRTVSYPEAVEVALCYGWIDGQGKRENDRTTLQRFTPRTKRSIWSKRNRENVLRLIDEGKMQPPGLAEIERAKQDGRWGRAYDSPSTATVPPELQRALDRNKKAKAFFATLNSQNRYAMIFRIQTAKKDETKAKNAAKFVEMLSKGETLYPQRRPKP